MMNGAESHRQINDILKRRWSPMAFSERPVDPEVLEALFEAARWSPSSANEQPWRFTVATRDDTEAYQKLFECLAAGNQRWAGRAPVILLAVAKIPFERYEGNNRHAMYDTGQAMAHLTTQAMSAGLFVHQMGGFDAEKARQTLSIPEGFEPAVMAVIGYADSPEVLPEDLRKRETAPRQRKPLEELVFEKNWGEPARFLHHTESAELAGNG